MDPSVDAFLKRATRWRDEMVRLRAIALDAGLQEAFKWGKPCYTWGTANVAIIQPFKERCAFMFFKGALLDDPQGLLERPGANSRVARRMMFADQDAIDRADAALRTFIKQAIEVEEEGRTVAPAEDLSIPDELAAMFGKVAGLEKAFTSLTPGRRRAYVLHFSSAKRPETRVRRIERHVPRILAGKGLDD